MTFLRFASGCGFCWFGKLVIFWHFWSLFVVFGCFGVIKMGLVLGFLFVALG
jgi:hypothetical protein